MVSYMFIVFLAVIVLVVVLTVILIGVAGGRRKRVTAPSCGSCGYAVEGLETLRCPECGSDLRTVGIITPATSGGVPRGVWAVLFTLFLPIPALVISGVLSTALPRVYQFQASTTLSSPRSGAFNSVVVSGEGTGRRGIRQADSIVLTLIPNDGRKVPTLTYLPADNKAIIGPPANQTIDQLSTEAIEAWFASAGVETSTPAITKETIDILRTIRMVEMGSSGGSTSAFGGMGGSSGSSTAPRTWFTVTMLIFWLAVWIGGLFLILRRRESKTA